MKKRLRKKRYLGEFRELGFSTANRFVPNLEPADFDRFLDEFIELMENRGLGFTGGGSAKDEWRGVVGAQGRFKSPDEADRQAVISWFEQYPDVTDFSVSEFWDLWHGTDPRPTMPRN